MTETNRYQELIRFFYRLEYEHDLFARKSPDGIPYWELVRHSVFYRLLAHHGFYPPALQQVPASEKPLIRLLKLLRLLPLVIVNESRLPRLVREKETVILLNSRNKADNGFSDLLFRDIDEHFGRKAFRMEFFTTDRREILRSSNRGKYFLVKLEWELLRNRTTSDRTVYLSPEICAALVPDCDLNALIENALRNYRTEYRFYRNILEKVQPRSLFFQTLPKSLVAAANDLNIQTFDLQHGHIDANDPFYGFHPETDTRAIHSVPKVYLTLHPYWNRFAHPTIISRAVGSTYFYPPEKQPDAAAVTFIPNRFIHDELSRIAKKTAQLHPERAFFYKLHSNQDDQLDATKSFFSEAPNVEVVIYKDINELLVQSAMIVLVQSTVAYQALQAGAQVAILKQFFYEASEDLFGLPQTHLFDTPEQLSAIVSRIGHSTDETPVFFAPFDDSAFEAVYRELTGE